MRSQTATGMVLALVFGVGMTTLAQEKAAAPPPAPTKGMRADFLSDLTEVQGKMVKLAEAFPQEKYTWRPGEGVRSVSEVFLHVAAGNFGFPRAWGVQPPAGIEPRGFDRSTTDKAKVIALLNQSYEHIRQAVLNMPDADLDKQVKLFGQQMTEGQVLFLVATHQHEHLGQSIAYARMNGVVPPWTAERQPQRPAAPAKKD